MGGQYNFVVQATRRASRNGHGRVQEAAKTVLERVEPDFVVGGKVDPRTFGVPDEQTRTFDDFHVKGGNRIGIDVMAVYRWRYEKDFRFVLRDPIPLRRCRGARDLSLFAATCFGEAPAHRQQALERAFSDLGLETEPLTPEGFTKAWTQSVTP